MTKNIPCFPILHVFAPLNHEVINRRAYIAWSWKTTLACLITWIFFTGKISNFRNKWKNKPNKQTNKTKQKTKMLFFMFSFLFFFFFFSFLFILIVWVEVAHVPCTRNSRSAAWMVWPRGLGHLPPSYLYPGGAWRGAAGHGIIALSIFLPLCCDCRVWVGGGGCSHSPCGPAYYLCLAWGSYLLGAWTSGPECVTC